MIYLASTSPRRKTILKQMGWRFQVVRPGYHETALPFKKPSMVVRRHALGKAESVAARVRKGVILAADTLVWCDGRFIGKPRNKKHAAWMLGLLTTRPHWVYTGVALIRVHGGKIARRAVFHETTRVRLRAMSRAAIRKYLATRRVLDKAGAYAIQSKSSPAVRSINGSFSNVVGLPVERLKKAWAGFMIERRRKGKTTGEATAS